MTRVSDRFLQLAVISALIGMSWGVQMGVSGDFTQHPAHAHLNLLGWVSMAIYALFYRAFPTAAESKLAGLHFWVAVLGLIVFITSLAVVLMGPGGQWFSLGENVIKVASLIVLASMAIFSVIVFRATTGSK